MMEKVIAYCGITCSDCPTFMATKADDDAERKRVAEQWTKEYGHPIKPEDINCDGCLTSGTRVFNYVEICEIRKCGQRRNVKNCAYCDDYKCDKISKLHEQAPKAKETLDETRRSMGKNSNPKA
jgi:hypothetical protein